MSDKPNRGIQVDPTDEPQIEDTREFADAEAREQYEADLADQARRAGHDDGFDGDPFEQT